MNAELNVKQELFAYYVAGGMSATRAYIKAGYKGSGKAAESNAARLIGNDKVSAALQKLRQKTAENLDISRDRLASHLFAAMTTPLDQIDGSSPFCQEFAEEVVASPGNGKGETIIRRRVKAVGKLEAARLLCDMMGWREPEKHVVDTRSVTLAEVKDRAMHVVSALSIAHRGENEAPNSGRTPSP
jgi:phage terminase small subunit